MSPALETVIAPLDGAPSDAAALPPEWADWAEEPGQRISVEENGRTLGTLHVAMVGSDEAWLEGLWIQPAARGRGVDRRLFEEAATLAAGYGATVVRTAAAAGESAVLAIAESMGFAHCANAAVGIAEIASGAISVPGGVRVTEGRPAEVAAIIGAIGASEYLGAWQGLVPLGWRFRKVRPELVRGLVKDGRMLRSGETVEGVAAFAVRGETAVVSFLDGAHVHRQALYAAVAERARAAGARRTVLFAPDTEGWTGIRAAFVPHSWCPNGLVILERRLSRGAGH
ncbi:MAG TPA: GNAT family N-acetyltransferase [bacterium]|nr:GNAT family N-acetyltransferase [bacterium]